MKQNIAGKNDMHQIAIVGNLKENFTRRLFDPPDAGAEFDKKETIDAMMSALETGGYIVIFLEADKNLPFNLEQLQPDICFNIAEGNSGDGREAQVPAICEYLGIPYTGSRVVANAISLDKSKTKYIWQAYGLPVGQFKEIASLEELSAINIDYPMIVKPAREGTGMGIDNEAKVSNDKELRNRVDFVIQTYHEPALVEEFLPGREFTVGYIGNPGSPNNRMRPRLYDLEGYHWFPVLEINSTGSVTPGLYGHHAKDFYIGEHGAPEYLCPADIPIELETNLINLTKCAAEAIGACDVSRVDFRLGADGEPYLLEINTLPGLNPRISDLCIMADAEGMEYATLISEILHLALDRYGLRLQTSHNIQTMRRLQSSVGAWNIKEVV